MDQGGAYEIGEDGVRRRVAYTREPGATPPATDELAGEQAVPAEPEPDRAPPPAADETTPSGRGRRTKE